MDLGVLDLPDKLKIEISVAKELLIIAGAVALLALLEGPRVVKKMRQSPQVPSLSAAQKELFNAPRKFERFEPIDVATSDDPLVQCLERQGWNPKRILNLQASISEKMTPDLFTGKTTKLTGGEVQLQENIDDCLQKISKSRGKKQTEGPMTLFGCGCPFRVKKN